MDLGGKTIVRDDRAWLWFRLNAFGGGCENSSPTKMTQEKRWWAGTVQFVDGSTLSSLVWQMDTHGPLNSNAAMLAANIKGLCSVRLKLCSFQLCSFHEILGCGIMWL